MNKLKLIRSALCKVVLGALLVPAFVVGTTLLCLLYSREEKDALLQTFRIVNDILKTALDKLKESAIG